MTATAINLTAMADKPVTTRDAALAYVAQDMKIFPCYENTKKPATKNGFYDASADEIQIIEWFTENPHYNIGTCPEDSGHVVIDVDTKNGKRGAESWAALGIKTRTYTVKSPSGGLHYWFKGSLPSSVNKLGDGLDVRGVGGYVLLPPSTIDGHAYEVVNDSDPASLPESIREALAINNTPMKAAVDQEDLPANIERACKLLTGYVGNGDVAIEGSGGDDRTYRLCCELLDLGLSEHKALDLLLELWNAHCQPPWEIEELEAKLHNASQYQQNEAGAYGVTSAAETFGEVVEKLAAETAQETNGADDIDAVQRQQQDSEAAERRKKFRGVKPSEGAKRPPATFWDQDKTFPRSPAGSRIFVFAKYSNHKTNFVAAKVIDAILEHDARAAYVAGEDADEFFERIKAQCASRGIPIERLDSNLLVIENCPHITDQAEVDAFMAELEPFAPNIIVCDTWSECLTGQDENSAKDASLAMHQVGRIRKKFCAEIVLVHHEGKNAAKGARGSSVFMAGANAVWRIRYDKEAGRVEQYIEKLKRGEPKRTIYWGVKIFDDVMTVVRPDAVTAEAMRKKAEAPARDVKSALKEQVITALYAAHKRDVLELTCEQIAEHINRNAAPAERDRLIANDIRSIQRGVTNGKKDSPLADLVRLNTRGEPIKPYVFILPDRYREAREELEEMGAHDE